MAGTNYPCAQWDETVKKWCPSCRQAKETAAHVSQCREVGRVKTLQATISFLDKCLEKVGTNPRVRKCVVWYARGHGFKPMEEVCGEDGYVWWLANRTRLGGGSLWREWLLSTSSWYRMSFMLQRGKGQPHGANWCVSYWKWYMDNGCTITSKCKMTAKGHSGH